MQRLYLVCLFSSQKRQCGPAKMALTLESESLLSESHLNSQCLSSLSYKVKRGIPETVNWESNEMIHLKVSYKVLCMRS